MNFLKNISIKGKLLIISLIPMLALMYFLYLNVADALERKATMLEVHDEFSEIESMSRLLHELQIERGLILTFLATRNDTDKAEMQRQMNVSDFAIAETQKIFSSHQKTSRILPFLDSVHFYRESLEAYSHRVNRYKIQLLTEMSQTLRKSKNIEIKNRLESHVFLLHSKEYFAQLRSILSSATSIGRFKKREYGDFAVLKGAAERNFARFRNTAPPEIVDFTSKKLIGNAVLETSRAVDSVFADPANLRLIRQDDWWTNSTSAINLLKQIENFSLSQVRELAESELTEINKSVYFSVGLTLVIVVLIVLVVSVTIRQVVSSITLIKEAAEKITNGDTDVHVPIHANDEMGTLAKSFNNMVEATKKYAEAADIIGKGNYTVAVPVRSNADLLGIALNNMRTNLDKLAKENQMRTWLLTGNSALNDSMRGDKHLAELAGDVATELAQYLNAQIGAMYIRNNGNLALTGSYAFDGKSNRSVIRLGEGLVGQAALKGKPIVFNDVPQDYVKINSGLGEHPPKNILVYPFQYEGEVKGVLEIGATKEFSQLDMSLLEMVGNNIGITVHAAQARERLKQLLEETQRQAEELESQQEELKQYNEELQEKTEMLERSEEELKSQQEELQQTNEELSDKAGLLEEQKQALLVAKMQIEDKINELEIVSKYKSEFLANMSHELRTPLNSILILAQVLKENRNNVLGSKELQFVNTIYHSGNDLLNLINQILDLSKIEAGKMELDVSEFAIGDIIKNIHNVFDEVASSKGIAFEIHVADHMDSQVISSDQQRIEQVLKNFLSNAFKFTEQGGKVTLTIGKPGQNTKFASKTLNTTTSVFAFTVADNGIGIPRDKQEAIFAAFQQVDGSTKRKYGGTGLGLSISRELSQLLGGEIHLESKEGSGSTFTLYIPGDVKKTPASAEDIIAQTAKAEATASSPADWLDSLTPDDQFRATIIEDDRRALKATDRKILIVEDDANFSTVLLEFVRERQYKGIIANDGTTGLRYAREYKPDAILLDMKLPMLSGGEVLKQLKADPELRHIPVQIISGYGNRTQGLKQGALDFIKKPVTKEAFWKAIDKIETFVSRKPKKLLIVEDDPQHNMAVKILIGNGDVNCYSAYSAKEGLAMLKKDDFDCVIVDMGLPDMSGFQFLEAIRQNEQLSNLPIIVYTGKSLSKEDTRRLDKLADSVVLKTAHSHDRLLDETTLFLHRVESQLPKEKQRMIRKLHKTEEVLKGKTVLIADDDPRNLFSLVSVLEQEGMECITVENGRMAVDTLIGNPHVDLVLMDVMMPEMDGYDATREIRQFEQFRNIPIIALTAKAMKGDREKCIAAGMSDYISKPLNVQQLVSLMRVWLYR
ncbi:MAG TPA: response regulator [Chryseosolibacter sp.]|nr:response regulator [Chryseosolibacter sp.]